ncbi:diguanylate cyclase domain-containing protein [Brumicola blandensis]|uniref:Diguanylate cyclase n=1 Tax=Brumicola blandensis TaxID=3075611 RepID=A0AAW8QXZ3_9ALTE|nr:diguanylate cyclase [Alteromonas sp. W409]MDT0581465.1 diguanylate cyclase [Alteromonas sp. W409]
MKSPKTMDDVNKKYRSPQLVSNISSEINALKAEIANRLMLALVILCCIGLPISLARWPNLGFQLVFAVHILLTASTIIMYFRPTKENYKVDYLYISAFLTLLAAMGLYSFGLQSGGFIHFIFAAFIIAGIFSLKASIIYLIFSSSGTAMLGLLFSQGTITHVIEPNIYASSMGAWSIAIFSGVITSTLFLTAGYAYYRKLKSSLELLETQNEKVEYLANHDHLTGLTSPRLAQEQLDLTLNLAKRHSFKAAILYIDVDDFKLINDALGHDAGDFALKEIANRLKDLIRDTDIACRQGGDEFLVILHYPVTKEACEEICRRLISAFDSRLPYKEHEIKINLSIGVAIYPDDGERQDELRIKADKAMYTTKHQQKNNYLFADEL